MAEWPMIDRELWPKPQGWRMQRRWKWKWPMEPECGWGPGPAGGDHHQPGLSVAMCLLQQFIHPQHGAEASRSGDRRVGNFLDRKYGVGFGGDPRFDVFQNPRWRASGSLIPAKPNWWSCIGRQGVPIRVRQWPDLYEALIKETNWNIISIGFESGSDRMLPAQQGMYRRG